MSSPSLFTPAVSGRLPEPAGSDSPAPLGASSSAHDGPPIDEPLRLLDLAEPVRRGPLPLLASLIPVLGSVALWMVTGSPFMLWFALLGPLMAVATRLDGRRAGRRDGAAHRVAADSARARVAVEVDERHDRERDRLWAGHPDVAAALTAGVVWTSTAERRQSIVVGAGARASSVRVSGGDADPASVSLRARAAVLEGAPVCVPAGIGIAVVGPAAIAAAVVRALAAQVVVASAPGDIRIVGESHGEASWMQDLPHARALTGLTFAAGVVGELPPDADIVLLRVPEGMPVPPRCGAVLTLGGVDRATLTMGADTTAVTVEALALPQATALADDLSTRASAVFGQRAAAVEPTLADLVVGAEPGDASPGRVLRAVVGTTGRAPFSLDLVADGPHAIVVGMTGAGKSELLISWVTSLCAGHSPDEVSFLLADFKGGTAFDALRELPHVTGVITDLDGAGARRALQSLSAELRWREAQLVQAGASDIRDGRVRMPRLVVIVDEFAALVAEHPELQTVFTDVAARGRALGMHLVLGTQRAAGVLRDALLANCPLRVCLRVADAADSRAVIGTDAAASLPGGAEGHGAALIRRAADLAPVSVRIARAGVELIAEVAARSSSGGSPRRPWLPELPAQLPLADLPRTAPDEIVLGLADDPDRQRQTPVLLGDRGLSVIGRPGSGRSTALAVIAAQAHDGRLVVIPSDAEAAWDAIAALGADDPWGDRSVPSGTVVLIDDLDSLLGGFPMEYAQSAGDALERVARRASARGIRVVISARRLSGATSRIADALPRRAILPTGARMDHIAAGGDAHDQLPDTPGRALLDGRLMQWADAGQLKPAPPARPATWHPGSGITGIVARVGSRRGLTRMLEEIGASTCTVDEFAARSDREGPTLVIGDPDAWLRNWRVLADIRGEHDLLIDASCAGEYRAITADRELPPYCAPGRRRAWLIRPGEQVVRVELPRRGVGVEGSE